MRHEERIIEAFKTNEIERILLIDDAYDSPEIDSDFSALTDFLESTAGHDACNKAGIDEDTIEAAIEALQNDEADSDELKTVIDGLYTSFYQKDEDQKFDPGGRFKELKEPALAALRPLCKLLENCGEVRTVGLEDGIKSYNEFHPHIIFLDYYLGLDVTTTGNADENSKDTARRASLDLLSQIVHTATASEEDIPAIVLLSSQKIDDVDEYRHEAKGRILALRFGFLKKDIVQQEGQIKHAAADVLLDVSQGYLFGKILQGALIQWRAGAKLALEDFIKEISNLHPKDFAYLLRFRLREEGQPLNAYLEWLFGESLKGLIEGRVNWNDSFLRLDHAPEIEEKIEGAFEGPSKTIAELFHRIRVNSYRTTSTRHGYRLGDLYMQHGEHSIRAVITPDCDLVSRKGKIKAKSILTMGGTLCTFDQENSAVDDFFIFDNKAYSVRWNPKDLKTFPKDGEESLNENGKFNFLGTLRPLYAQEMQRRALTDLSRIGLLVAPALGLNATVTVWVRKARIGYEEITINASPRATIVPAREGQKDGHRVLLTRQFVNELIDRLNEVRQEGMREDDKKLLQEALKEDGGKLYKTFLRIGGLTNAKSIFGIGFVIRDKPDRRPTAPWLQIVLKISAEEMEELRTIDPLE